MAELRSFILGIKLVDDRMTGATRRLYLSGTGADIRRAAWAAEEALGNLA